MQKAYAQNIISIIKKNLVSYMAIMMLIFFSVELYTASYYLIMDSHLSYDNCFDYCKKPDVSIYISEGADEGIIDSLKDVKGTDEIESIYISYGYIDTKFGKLNTEILTLSKSLALPIEVEGQLPKKKNEIAILKHWAKQYDVKIGDILKVQDNNYLTVEDFIVTATFESSQFSRKISSSYGISKISGETIMCVGFVNDSALSSNYVEDNYIMLRNNKLRGLSRFSDEYKNVCEDYIDRVKNNLELITSQDFYIEKWNEEWGYYLVNTFTHMTSVVYKVLVPMFLLVAIATLISSIRRMILDQNNEIGIMKANGFTSKEIANIFYFYAISATFLGSILGDIFATFVTEKILINYAATVVTLKDTGFIFDFVTILLTIVIPLIIVTVVTHLCISKILKKEALDILNEKSKNTIKVFFYEQLYIFKKLPIFVQMIINNMFKDARRCVGIIFGIAGSMMLLLCGIVINRNLNYGFNYQINNDVFIDKLIFFRPATYAKNEIEDILIDNKIEYSLVQYTEMILKNPENKPNMFSLFVYDDKDDFSKLFRFNTLNKKEPKYKGIFIQESYKTNFNLNEHGYIKIRDLKGDYKYQRTSCYFYNYLLSPIAAMDKDTYEEIFDMEPYMQAFAIGKSEKFDNDILKKLEDVDGYLYYINYRDKLKREFTISYNFLNAIMGVFVFTAIMLSFLIVLNLMKVNIMERKEEFMVLRVNGFTNKEIGNYVILDMVIMIVIGNIIGLILGSISGSFVLSCFTSDMHLFLNKLNYSAMIISIIISIIINVIITKLSMKEVNGNKKNGGFDFH